MEIVKISRSACAVPTGTVDFPTTRAPSFKKGAIAAIADLTNVKSAARPSLLCGVPTHIKLTSASAAAEKSVVKVSLPVLISEAKSESRPGS